MKKCHRCGREYDEIFDSCPKCSIVRPEEISSNYRFWWILQVLSLFVFLALLVFSILFYWWYLVIGFGFLSFNLYANIRRLRVLNDEIMALHLGEKS
ncbi:MAG: hypothetical protein PHT95_06160 [Candidatus Omnitrophica bacterium]|jgi:hypothetical protein|nr:hypothetical protein [Candidatus Omnitrophota bacterium]MDD4013149.1 hypothetical protein [Candidatus Omnitrophota bacterium]